MEKRKLNLKATVLSLGLAAGMMLPASASAQGAFGNMLDNYYEEQDQASHGALLRGRGSESYNLSNEQFNSGSSNSFQLSNQTFGPDAPLGSGLFIMAAAGAGYAIGKRKKNEKHQ